jgi:hypothetical protein
LPPELGEFAVMLIVKPRHPGPMIAQHLTVIAGVALISDSFCTQAPETAV